MDACDRAQEAQGVNRDADELLTHARAPSTRHDQPRALTMSSTPMPMRMKGRICDSDVKGMSNSSREHVDGSGRSRIPPERKQQEKRGRETASDGRKERAKHLARGERILPVR